MVGVLSQAFLSLTVGPSASFMGSLFCLSCYGGPLFSYNESFPMEGEEEEEGMER